MSFNAEHPKRFGIFVKAESLLPTFNLLFFAYGQDIVIKIDISVSNYPKKFFTLALPKFKTANISPSNFILAACN